MFIDNVPPHILAIEPYRPGKPISEVKRELGLDDVIKMASNENPLGPSPKAVEMIKRNVSELNYYPEDSGFYLKQRLCAKLSVSSDMIVLGNGSSEIIVNVGRAFLRPGDEILTSAQSFVMYYLSGAYMGNTVIKVPLKDYRYDLAGLVAHITPATRIIFIANPNNPTGTYVSAVELERFLDKVPDDILVVVDEAYCEYVLEPDYPNALKYLSGHPNLLVLRSFSKIYGLAGIRVGYGIGSPDLVGILNRVKLPFNANALGQDAAAAALDDNEFVDRSRKTNRQGLDFLHRFMAENHFDFQTSVGNFIMVVLPVEGSVVAGKMERLGIIVRPLKSFGVNNAIRVTVGRQEENERFAEAFLNVMSEIGAGK